MRLENSATGNRSDRLQVNSSSEHSLPMIEAVENAQRGDVSMQNQSVKPFTDMLYAIKWFKLILQCTSLEERTAL